MYFLPPEERKRITGLYADSKDSCVWSCLEGVMGRAYLPEKANDASALIVSGDFCFLAGKPEDTLIVYATGQRQGDELILVPANEDWSSAIEKLLGKRAERLTRYAIKKERDVFNPEKLGEIVSALPEPYTLRAIDEKLYPVLMDADWSRDFCRHFQDSEDFLARGMGFVAMYENEPVAGASSYTVYREGIEVVIATRTDHRRKGLAMCCGAKLILACLERGLYPNWDAANLASVGVSEKLGYHLDGPYPAYRIL